MITDAITVIQFLQKLAADREARGGGARESALRVAQLSQALAHEIRTALNQVELALSAHEKRDGALRDHVVRSLQLPLLEALARGLYGEPLDAETAARFSRDIPVEAEENAELIGDIGETQELESVGRHELCSRLVARVESMRILAGHEREIPWVRWSLRLQRVRRELVGMLHRVLEETAAPGRKGAGA